MSVADQPFAQSFASSSDTPVASDQNRDASREINVGDMERTLSIAAGAIMALVGLSRRSNPGLLATGLGGALVYRGLSGHCHLYKALGVDTAASQREASPQDYHERGIHVVHAFTIAKPADELYRFWRNFENLPRFMEHLESVHVMDDRRSHWVAKAPKIAGGSVEWDAEIINDEPNALIAWRSLPDADVHNAGSIRFVPAPGDRGTEVRVVIDYLPPAGQVGKLIARLFGEEPQQTVREDLRRFKQLMETGEIPTIEDQPKGTCSGGGKRHAGV